MHLAYRPVVYRLIRLVKLTARGLPPLISSLAQLTPFGKTGVALRQVHKTGLGSSAALITSLVSALLVHLNVVSRSAFDLSDNDEKSRDVSTDCDRRLAHNLAQYVHCLAQGKVGSGFDVAAAVFGSQLYTRFDPGVIASIMHDDLVRFLFYMSSSISSHAI
jgi:phosphomevalonate kinase